MNSSPELDEITKILEKELANTMNAVIPLENLSVDRKILLIKMILTLKALINSEELAREVIGELVKSFEFKPASQSTESYVEEKVLRYYVSDASILLKLKRRKRITVSELLNRKSSVEDIVNYIWLRREGYLVRSRSGALVVNAEKISSITPGAHRVDLSISDVLKYLPEIPSSLWSKIIDRPLLGKLDNTEFARFVRRFCGYNTVVDEMIASELVKRIREGWRMKPSVLKAVSRIIKNNRELSSLYIGPQSLYWIKPRKLSEKDADRIAKDLARLPLRDRWRVVSRMSKVREFEPILEKLDPLSLSVISGVNSISNSRLRSKVLLGQSLASYLRYLVTGEVAHFEYSKYLLLGVDHNHLDEELKPIYKYMVSGEWKDLMLHLSRKYWIEAIEYIANTVWDHARTAGTEASVLAKALRLGLTMLKYGVRGGEYRGEAKYSSTRGRLAVRRTVYRVIRGDYSIVRKYREKHDKIIAVVDTSGSMLKYSLWTIASLATMLPVVKAIVLFSDTVRVFKPPKNSFIQLALKYLEQVFSGGFKGYTNISLALREAGKLASGGDVVIVLTDLEQTVQDTEPWVEVQTLLKSKCRRVVFIVPPEHRDDVAARIKSSGGEVVVVEDPSSIPKIVRRKLNLKIRLSVFHT